MKEKIIETINALSHAFQEESDKEHIETVKNLVEKYHYLDLKEPEKFALLTSLTFDEQADLLVRIVLSHVLTKSIDRKLEFSITFIYKKYNFIERHLDRIINKYEGLACSSDKTRWLLDTYVDYLLNGEIKTIQDRNYWHPKLTDVKLWMDWIASMENLYYGLEEDYVKTKALIISQYEEINGGRLTYLDDSYSKHQFFTSKEKVKDNEEYTFICPATNDKGTIIVKKNTNIAYRFYFDEEQKYAKYNDTKPEWFDELLKL